MTSGPVRCETLDSIRQRAQAAEQLRLANEPAQAIEHGRPTKRVWRDIEKAWPSANL